jgi:DNA-binding transcriptional MerR regulator
MTDLPIGQVAERTGVKVPTIRYYETIGLLPPPSRSDGNRRLYGPRDVKRLAFIRHARDLGFDIEHIRILLSLQANPQQPCATADAIARERLADVERRIAALTALKDELEHMVGGCTHGCVGECRVIEVLADHGRCVHEHHAAG